MANDKKHILIVEDENPMARVLSMKLQQEGFEATIVGDGEAGIKSLEKDQYDLILLDILMPKVDGFSFLQKAKDMGNTVPIVVITNLSQQGDMHRAEELGAAKYLIKTDVNLNQIIDTVRETLED
ncbi:response regulator [candidate division WWE3 bacterium]|uniref:Response regulator n=1 Tax=candidate division WWE3 bacterium TaxID=2053526 RepID=A0A955RQG6_UNCKA|nr:response regulator [candidate division WWE3 bacterium]